MRINRAIPFIVGSVLALAGCQKGDSDAPTISANAPAAGDPGAATPVAAAPAPVLTKAMATVPAWVGELHAADGVKCYADKVNDQGGAGKGEHRSFKSGERFTLLGWSVDTSLPPNSVQPTIMVVLKSATARYAFPALRHDRPDVSSAAEFKGQLPKNVGVMLDASLEGVPAGSYQLEYVLGEGSSAKLCDLGAPWSILVTE